MRSVLVASLLLLAACEFPHDSGGTKPPVGVIDGGIYVEDTIPDAAYQSTCPFGEGTEPVKCSTENAYCQIETWEHGCDCTCDANGYWNCFAETIGSTCPRDPLAIDGGTPQTGCGAIEAESAASHDGWAVSSVPWTHGGAELSASLAGAAFTLPFDGTSVTLYYEKGPGRGEITVTIDHFAPVAIEAGGSGSNTWGNGTLVADELAPGPHTATIACAALDCDVDYIDVTCP